MWQISKTIFKRFAPVDYFNVGGNKFIVAREKDIFPFWKLFLFQTFETNSYVLPTCIPNLRTYLYATANR